MGTKNTNLRNLLSDAFGGAFDSGTLQIRTSGGTVLVEFTLELDAFPAAVEGKVSANALPKEATASGTGTANNAILSSPGGTYVLEGLSVGTTNAKVIIDNTSIGGGQIVNLIKFDWTEPANIA